MCATASKVISHKLLLAKIADPENILAEFNSGLHLTGAICKYYFNKLSIGLSLLIIA